MLQYVKQKIENIRNKSLSQDDAVKVIRTIGGHSTIIGISLVISIFASFFLEQNWLKFYLFLKDVNLINVIFILIALAFIVYGIALLANYGTKEKIKKENELKIGKLIFVQIIKQLPYAIPTTIIMLYIKKLLDDDITWITNNFQIVLLMNALVIYFLLLISVKIILNSYKIFNNSIPENKDRLTIIITIFATIISSIALFK